HLGRATLELLRGQPLEELDGIVIDLPPEDGVELAEECNDVRLPDPPEIPGQFSELVHELTLTYHALPRLIAIPEIDTLRVRPRERLAPPPPHNKRDKTRV